MSDNDNHTEATTPAGSGEAQQDVAQSGNANGEATGIAKASDELADEDLEAVAGGRGSHRGGEAGRPEDRRHR
jgi:hypothetical protein